MKTGMQVRIMRTCAGLSQIELAAKVGIDQGTMSNIENGRVEPRAELFDDIKAALTWPPSPLDDLVFAVLDGEVSTVEQVETWVRENWT